MLVIHQEGLPDYWGIEKISASAIGLDFAHPIRKDYPTTGVLKKIGKCYNSGNSLFDQEGLPDYWGIENSSSN